MYLYDPVNARSNILERIIMNRCTQTSKSRIAFREKSCILRLRTIAATKNITAENASVVSAGYYRRRDVVGVVI